jgi:hypothetical protein
MDKMTNFFMEFKVVNAKTRNCNWNGMSAGKLFFCAFCGHDFEVGDEFRAIYTNDMPGASGNPLCCRRCFDAHGEVDGVRKVWAALCAEYKTRFKWWAAVER